MANYNLTYEITLTDANGDTATMAIPGGLAADTVTLATIVAPITSFLTALGTPGTITNAKVTSAVMTVLFEKANPNGAVDAEFSSVTDGARLNFENSLGNRGALTIPAPVPTVFGAAPNEDVVDAGGAAAPLIAWYTAHAAARGGDNLLNVYNGGVKVGRHARRRAQHKVG